MKRIEPSSLPVLDMLTMRRIEPSSLPVLRTVNHEAHRAPLPPCVRLVTMRRIEPLCLPVCVTGILLGRELILLWCVTGILLGREPPCLLGFKRGYCWEESLPVSFGLYCGSCRKSASLPPRCYLPTHHGTPTYPPCVYAPPTTLGIPHLTPGSQHGEQHGCSTNRLSGAKACTCRTDSC